MLTATHHAAVRAMLADAAPDGILLDYLAEAGASLSEVLLLYAGTAPEYTDGLGQAALAEWCRRTELFRPSGDRHMDSPLWRWQEVLDIHQAALHTGINAGRRDRKRRTLALFPEVRIREVDVVLSERDLRVIGLENLRPDLWRLAPVAQRLHLAADERFRPDLPVRHQEIGGLHGDSRSWRFSQVVNAPYLIPPEPQGCTLQIFAAGRYRDREYTEANLDQMVANFEANRGDFVVRVTSGPEESTPPLGHVASLQRRGNTLHAQILIPDPTQHIRFGRVSAEIYTAPPEDCQGEGPMLRRVVLLRPESESQQEQLLDAVEQAVRRVAGPWLPVSRQQP